VKEIKENGRNKYENGEKMKNILKMDIHREK
jgi:hypothetical protein